MVPCQSITPSPKEHQTQSKNIFKYLSYLLLYQPIRSGFFKNTAKCNMPWAHWTQTFSLLNTVHGYSASTFTGYTIGFMHHSLVFSLRGQAGRNHSPVPWPVWLLAHCILGKFLGVVCHCFPLPLDVPTFTTTQRNATTREILVAKGGTVGEKLSFNFA